MAKIVRPATELSGDGNRVPAVERAFAIIRLLAAQGPLSLAEVVEETGLNKSTIFYTLRTLVALDVVAYDEGTRAYGLGPALMELGLIASGHPALEGHRAQHRIGSFLCGRGKQE